MCQPSSLSTSRTSPSPSATRRCASSSPTSTPGSRQAGNRTLLIIWLEIKLFSSFGWESNSSHYLAGNRTLLIIWLGIELFSLFDLMKKMFLSSSSNGLFSTLYKVFNLWIQNVKMLISNTF